jgi:hemoglobin
MSDAPKTKTLYDRLGGHAALTAVANNLLPRLQQDKLLGRFWAHRGTDGIAREKQLLVDYLSSCAGGPIYYTGRGMKLSHAGMRIGEADWQAFLGHLDATLDAFQVPIQERGEVVAFIDSVKVEILDS